MYLHVVTSFGFKVTPHWSGTASDWPTGLTYSRIARLVTQNSCTCYRVKSQQIEVDISLL